MEWVSYTRAISSKKDEENPPDVIGRQNAHIEKYLREHGFKLRKKYSDRKYSADKAEAFNLLVQDGMKRDFYGIVVDSVFRFGRDFWTAKEILADTFYPAGIQFAVVEDDFCSIGKEKSEVLEYFKKKRKELTSSDGILRYARSLESGVIPRTMIKYGFVLSEDNRSFEIEEEGATVIRKIYEMFISGKNFSDIAKELNKRGITSPQEQKALKAGKEANVIVPGLWYGSTIKRILNDPMYMGKEIRKVRGKR